MAKKIFDKKGTQLTTTLLYILMAIGAILLMGFAVYTIKSKIFG